VPRRVGFAGEQDRGLWHGEQIQEGTELVKSALRRGAAGAYTLQASIAALHANAKTAKDTDWPQIAALYDALLRMHTSPVIEVNRAVAVAHGSFRGRRTRAARRLERREELENFTSAAARANLLRVSNAWRSPRMHTGGRYHSLPNDISAASCGAVLTELEKLRDLRS